MNPNWSDADSWLDVIDHVWIGLVVILAAGVPTWLSARNHRAIKTVSEQTAGVMGQVANGHTDPLRQDLDRLIGSVDELRGETAELRGEMRGITHRLDVISERRIEQRPYDGPDRRNQPWSYDG